MGKVPEQPDATKVPKKAQKKAALDEAAKIKLYITKVNQRLNAEEKTQFSLSSKTIEEAELLINHAVRAITTNAAAILKYSGTETLGPKTAAAATKVAFSGLLRNDVIKAGDAAVTKYEKAMGYKPKAPKAPKAVAVAEP